MTRVMGHEYLFDRKENYDCTTRVRQYVWEARNESYHNESNKR